MRQLETGKPQRIENKHCNKEIKFTKEEIRQKRRCSANQKNNKSLESYFGFGKEFKEKLIWMELRGYKFIFLSEDVTKSSR